MLGGALPVEDEDEQAPLVLGAGQGDRLREATEGGGRVALEARVRPLSAE